MFSCQRLMTLLFLLVFLLVTPFSASFSHDHVPMSPFLHTRTIWGKGSLPTMATVKARTSSSAQKKWKTAQRAVVYDYSDESHSNNKDNKLYSWLDDDDTISTSQSASPWRQHLVEELSNVHHMGALARLACAFSPPEQALQLQHLEHVSVLTVDESHLEIMAVVCEASGCVTIQVPVGFPKPCLNDSDEECILHQFEILDHHAETILKSQHHQLLEHEDASVLGFSPHNNHPCYHDDNNDFYYSNQGTQTFTTTSANPIPYPLWWVPCHSLDLMSDCEKIQQLLNDPDFVTEMQTLALYGLEFQSSATTSTTPHSEHEQHDSSPSSWTVDQVMVAAVGPSGLILRARAWIEDLASSGTGTINSVPTPTPQLMDIPLSFGHVAESIEEIRASVLGMVAAVTSTTSNEGTFYQGEVEAHQEIGNFDDTRQQEKDKRDHDEVFVSVEVPVETALEERSESLTTPTTLQAQNDDLELELTDVAKEHAVGQPGARQVDEKYSQWEEMLHEDISNGSTTMEQRLPDWWVVPIEPDLLEECDTMKILLNRETCSSELRMLAERELSKQALLRKENHQDDKDAMSNVTIHAASHGKVNFVMVTNVCLSGLHLRATATANALETNAAESRVMNIFVPFKGAAETVPDLRTNLLETVTYTPSTTPTLTTPDAVADIIGNGSTDASQIFSNAYKDTSNDEDEPEAPTNLLECVTNKNTARTTSMAEAVVEEPHDDDPSKLVEAVTCAHLSTPATEASTVREDVPTTILEANTSSTSPATPISEVVVEEDDDDGHHNETEGQTNLVETVTCAHLSSAVTEAGVAKEDKNNIATNDTISIAKDDNTDIIHDQSQQEEDIVEIIAKATMDK